MSISRGRAKSKTWNIQHFSACQLITIGTTASTEQQHNDLLFFTAGNQQNNCLKIVCIQNRRKMSSPSPTIVWSVRIAFIISVRNTLRYGLRVEYSIQPNIYIAFELHSFCSMTCLSTKYLNQLGCVSKCQTC